MRRVLPTSDWRAQRLCQTCQVNKLEIEMQFVILAEASHNKVILERRSQDVELAPEAPYAKYLV